jgi:N-terminal half of MaoC dehydratase
MAKTSISAAMQAAIGGELGRSTSFPITDSDIRRWAVAIYYPEDPPRLFWDADYAAQTSYGGIVAPEEFNPFAWMTADGPRKASVSHDPDLTEITLGIEGPGLKFQLNGGSEVEYGVRMRPGDVVSSVRSLAGYSEREGRLGLMLFTVSQDVWTNQNNEVVKTTKSTLIRY